MPSIINASTSSGIVQTADTSGSLELQANGSTKLTVGSSGVTSPTTTVTTLNAPSGVLATQNGMTGIAKAWVAYNSIAQTIYNSFNVSSVTYNGTGDITVNFTTAMPNTTYCPVMSGGYSTNGANPSFLISNRNASGGNEVAPTTSATRFSICNTTGNANDVKYAYVAFLSS